MRNSSRFMAIAGISLLYGCATSDTVNVDSLVPNYKVDDSRVVVTYRTGRSLAAIATEDWGRVEKLSNLTNNTDTRSFISAPEASPTQDAIVYAQYRDESSGIVRQATTSQAKTTITESDALNLTPTFTPDGQFLVFSSNRSGEGQDLWRKRADGAGGITQVTTSTAFDFRPSVAENGETIVFQSHRVNDLESSVWSVNMFGGLLTQLSAGESPKVSPDGRRVAFVKRDARSGMQTIWVMQIDGSGQTQLSAGNVHDKDPSWHPSGRYIIFSSNESRNEDGDHNFDIWLMNSDGTNRLQLTSNISQDDAPVFDRSGRRVVFRSNRGGAWNLYTFEPNLRAAQ